MKEVPYDVNDLQEDWIEARNVERDLHEGWRGALNDEQGLQEPIVLSAKKDLRADSKELQNAWSSKDRSMIAKINRLRLRRYLQTN